MPAAAAPIPPPHAPASFADTLLRLLTLAWPIVVARLGVQTMGLVDAVVVGRFSTRELSWHALGWAPTSIVLTGALGLLVGVQVMTARRVGEGRPELAGAVLRRGLAYALWIGLVSTVLLAAAGGRLMSALRLSPELAAGSGRAMQVFALSLTPYLLGCVLSFWLEGLGRPRPGMRAIWAANALNLALNPLFVPGAWGLPAMGAVGAGWATLGARTLYSPGWPGTCGGCRTPGRWACSPALAPSRRPPASSGASAMGPAPRTWWRRGPSPA